MSGRARGRGDLSEQLRLRGGRLLDGAGADDAGVVELGPHLHHLRDQAVALLTHGVAGRLHVLEDGVLDLADLAAEGVAHRLGGLLGVADATDRDLLELAQPGGDGGADRVGGPLELDEPVGGDVLQLEYPGRDRVVDAGGGVLEVAQALGRDLLQLLAATECLREPALHLLLGRLGPLHHRGEARDLLGARLLDVSDGRGRVLDRPGLRIGRGRDLAQQIVGRPLGRPHAREQ